MRYVPPYVPPYSDRELLLLADKQLRVVAAGHGRRIRTFPFAVERAGYVFLR